MTRGLAPASLVAALCLLGCGDDAASADGSMGPVSGDVSVTTYVRQGAFAPGTPVGAVTIDVVQADGTGAQTALTDPDGHVTLHHVRPDAIVSATYPPAQQALTVTSFTGVQPGDQLTFGDGYFKSDTSSDFVITVGLADFPGAQGYEADTSCGTNFGVFVPEVTVPLGGCWTRSGPLVLLVFGTSGLAGSRFLPSIPYVSGTIVDPGPWVANGRGNFAMSITGLDHMVPIGLDATASYGDQLQLLSFPDSSTAATASITMPVTAPRIVGHARLDRTTDSGSFPDSRFGFADVYRSISGTATSLELSAPTVPFVGGGVYNPTLQRAAWLQGDGGYDGATLTLDWTLTNSAPNFSNVHWLVVVPPGQTDLDLAMHPPGLAHYLPTAMDTPSVMVRLIDYDDVSGYDAFRALPEWQLAPDRGMDNLAVEYGDRSGGQIATGVLP